MKFDLPTTARIPNSCCCSAKNPDCDISGTKRVIRDPLVAKRTDFRKELSGIHCSALVTKWPSHQMQQKSIICKKYFYAIMSGSHGLSAWSVGLGAPRLLVCNIMQLPCFWRCLVCKNFLGSMFTRVFQKNTFFKNKRISHKGPLAISVLTIFTL